MAPASPISVCLSSFGPFRLLRRWQTQPALVPHTPTPLVPSYLLPRPLLFSTRIRYRWFRASPPSAVSSFGPFRLVPRTVEWMNKFEFEGPHADFAFKIGQKAHFSLLHRYTLRIFQDLLPFDAYVRAETFNIVHFTRLERSCSIGFHQSSLKVHFLAKKVNFWSKSFPAILLGHHTFLSDFRK